ncbi:MAG: aldehyde dehydrogenase family protein [Candidatus Eisenbacteria bacterium]|nr:aldehyde dehydrogenase family protein [Candidatus Latescibacterota bacterium]MBD3301181.1 aldehyde dehydrogenase family protein [Candidatus Eisenbacteria bacterium]
MGEPTVVDRLASPAIAWQDLRNPMEPERPEQRYADELLQKAVAAAEAMLAFSQKEVDAIVEAVYRVAYAARIDLAVMAYEETGIGVLEHKVVKNAWASLLVYEDIRDLKTVGVVGHDPRAGITEIVQPKGPILALLPLTNPTSTAIFKILICLKSRNPVIFSPHRAARKSIKETVRLLEAAAVTAGAPPGAIQIATKPQKDHIEAVMRHRDLAMILATGTGSVVRWAQSSGTPTYGVGPGNVPVYVDRSADLPLAARSIVHSKTFDNGTVCASEQAIVALREIDGRLRELLEERGGYFCSQEDLAKLGQVAFDPVNRGMKADVVGRSAADIAERAGVSVPEGTRLLIVEPAGIGREYPLSHEILAPILAYYVVRSYDDAISTCIAVNEQGGIGHTVGLYANDERVIEDFGRLMHAGRICVNQPTTQGAIGGLFNTLSPSLTLSCGSGGGNITTDNISVSHLLNVHRVARRRVNSRWMQVPREIWQDPEVGPEEIRRLYNRNH